jgi:Tfp pilus assembly protein PilN
MSSPNQLSFLPDDYLERKAQRRTNVICAALFVIVLGAIASAFTITERQNHRVERQHADVEKAYTEAARRLEQVNQMQEKQRRMAHQAELTASLLEKVPRSHLLAEITNSLPPGVSLLDLSMESRQRTAPALPLAKTMYEQKQNQIAAEKLAAESREEIRRYDVSLKLSGVAATDVQVAQFINKLGRSKFLRDVNLVVVDEFSLDGDNMRKFQLEMMLNPDADVNPSEVDPGKTAAVPVEK